MKRRDFFSVAGSGAAALLAAAYAGPAHGGGARPGPFLDLKRLADRNRDRSTVVCQHGMVCASQPLAAMAGIDILKRGGNCVDAAICANAMLGVTEAASNGMGGDLFAILWVEQDQKLYGLNASGRSPKAWTLKQAKKLNLDEIPSRSPLAWSVPGCVSGWAALNERFGSLKLGECLEAAITHARDGFPLSPIISTYFDWPSEMAPHMAAVYHPGGQAPKYGDIFKNPMLARSLESVAKEGAAAFYEGWIAEAIVKKSQELGGFMALEDLKSHTATWVDPVSTNYRGWDVWEIPPNGQGISALQMLNILEGFELGGLAPNSAEHLHLFVEAKKLAYEDRAKYYADPEFADVPVEWLISKEYGKQRAQLIDPEKASVTVGHGDPELDSDTIYLTAADGAGNMISLIQSNYSGYGSTICPDGVGFPIQNRGEAFSLDKKHRNRLEPGKRPFHTIIPAFMTRDGKPVMSFGVMGGDFQPQGHVQIVMNMIDFGMSPQQAGDQPRLEHTGSSNPWGGKMEAGGSLVFEHGFSDAVKVQLAQLGHRIKKEVGAHGGYQAIWREDDPLRYFGGSDPRKDGAALGY
ncbi:MAG: gamma-glutamyltransferase [Candidatus Hydrogenedentes bacterium]|nr:gamma-glutamyltransferase [Candidatus Hydrogenedentota bacterium]